MIARLAAIVPSLGAAPDLERGLERLRAELAGVEGDLIWVHQGSAPPPRMDGKRERLIRLAAPVGFARAVNEGVAGARAAELLLVVNDDLVVEPGWLAALVGAIDADPGLAAVQGVHASGGAPTLGDGWGIGWNRWLQAVQLGQGEPLLAAATADFEIFGASATGALYRRAALERVALADGAIFDPRLDSWYEDVDLAVRLRAAGFRARCVPAARARHAGSATGDLRPFARARRVTGNRWLVVSRLLGRAIVPAAPRLLARDLVDALRAATRGELARAAGVPAGWLWALGRLGAFAHFGPPALSREELERFRVGSSA